MPEQRSDWCRPNPPTISIQRTVLPMSTPPTQECTQRDKAQYASQAHRNLTPDPLLPTRGKFAMRPSPLPPTHDPLPTQHLSRTMSTPPHPAVCAADPMSISDSSTETETPQIHRPARDKRVSHHMFSLPPAGEPGSSGDTHPQMSDNTLPPQHTSPTRMRHPPPASSVPPSAQPSKSIRRKLLSKNKDFDMQNATQMNLCCIRSLVFPGSPLSY